MFNEGRYHERALAGEFDRKIRDRPLDMSKGINNAIEGTVTREERYIDKASGEEIARVHYYLRPDGVIAASGLVDPKRLRHEGVLYGLPMGTKEDESDKA